MEKGNIVVCIDDSNIPKGASYLRRGSIYTIVSIKKYGKGVGICVQEIDKRCNIRLKDMSIAYNERIPYNINRFELIDTPTSISIEEVIKEKRINIYEY